jgi:hypothetical protein
MLTALSQEATIIGPALEIYAVCELLVGSAICGGYILAGGWSFIH